MIVNWLLDFTGKHDQIKARIDETRAKLTGKEREEFELYVPHIVALVDLHSGGRTVTVRAGGLAAYEDDGTLNHRQSSVTVE